MPYFSDNEHFSSVMTGLGGVSDIWIFLLTKFCGTRRSIQQNFFSCQQKSSHASSNFLKCAESFLKPATFLKTSSNFSHGQPQLFSRPAVNFKNVTNLTIFFYRFFRFFLRVFTSFTPLFSTPFQLFFSRTFLKTSSNKIIFLISSSNLLMTSSKFSHDNILKVLCLT